MRASKVIKRFIYILIMTTFLVDSYFKVTQIQREADLFRSKYSLMQDFIKRSLHYELPFSIEQVANNSILIVSLYAAFEGLFAVLVILGQRQIAIILIIMTLLQSLFLHNPYYRNTTEIDKQKCFKNIFNDLGLICTLFMVSDFKKIPKSL